MAGGARERERERELRFGGSPSSRQVHHIGPAGEVIPGPAPRRQDGASPGTTRWRHARTIVPLLHSWWREAPSRAAEDGARTSDGAAAPVAAGAAVVGLRRQVTLVERVAHGSLVALVDGLRAFADVEPHVTAQRAYHGRALLCLRPKGALRRLCIATIEWRWFDRAVLAVIAANCAFLAAQQPWSPALTWWEPVELAFQVVFTVELVIKVGALGLALHEGAYLRDAWNWIDFVVVLVGWLAYFPAIENVSAIRSFRLLRPLRTITQVRGMRVIVTSLLDSVPMMANVLLLFAFVIFCFGVIGVQLFMGRLRYRCFPSAGAPSPSEPEQVCHCGVDFFDFSRAPTLCPPELEGFYRCPGAQVCRQVRTNPNYGVTSFDNLGAAVYNIFEGLTLEGWTDVVYMLQAGSDSPLPVVFMSALVVFLAFFIVNLFLAVIFLSFENARKAEQQAQASSAQRDAAAAAAAGDGGVVGAATPAGAAAVPMHNCAYRVITHARFTAFFTLVIVANTLLMACEYHRMPEDLSLIHI